MLKALQFPWLAGLVLLAGQAAAVSLDFRSVSDAAILRDAPSDKAAKLFVIERGTPVEVVLASGNWRKVRDQSGKLAWIEASALGDHKSVIVRVARAQVRSAADDKAALVFEAEQDVLLEPVEAPKAGWVAVKHADGKSGFVRVGQIWGL